MLNPSIKSQSKFRNYNRTCPQFDLNPLLKQGLQVDHELFLEVYMLNINKLIPSLINGFNSRIEQLPFGFYTTWGYTETGNNFTHPVTLGFLISELEKVLNCYPALIAGVDTRFNSGVKFQPDLSMLDPDLSPWLFVDYESPNSSDARVPVKDVDAYNAFSTSTNSRIPYIIITTLPDQPSPYWKLRYYSKGNYNDGFKEHRSEILENPFRFWSRYYQAEMLKRDISNIHFLNISEKGLHSVSFQ